MMDRTGHPATKAGRIEREAENDRERMKKHADEVVISSDDSFPASDPPSFNPGVTGGASNKKKRN
jgi:hypothetical protein